MGELLVWITLTGGYARNEDAFQGSAFIAAKADVSGGEIIAQPFPLFGTWDRQNVFTLMQDPGNRDLCCRIFVDQPVTV